MEITVKNLFKRISPRKVRPSLYGLKDMVATKAADITKFGSKKADRLVNELILSGLAACKEQYLDIETVTIKSISCNEGPRLKRSIPWSKGVSRRIVHRLAHLILVLSAEEAVKPVKAAASKEIPKTTKEK
ncbi:MAG: uL22 family ribosomal protein [Candidatus Berkelbacteria bacterium]